MFNKDEIIQKLTEKKATLPCSRCGNRSFGLLEGYSKFYMQDLEKIGDINLSDPFVPVIGVFCTKCGAITFHAAGTLGLLKKEGDANEK